VLNVTYKPAANFYTPDHKEVYFKFIDKRSQKNIIGNGAQEVFKGYSGKINFSVSKGEKEESFVGIYDVESLFNKAFSMYLGNMGLTILSEPKKGTPELYIRLNDFTLDLSGRKWIAGIDYEAEFVKDNKTLTRRFKGQSERFRIYGLDQANQAVSDAFTDIINQLDLKTLFTDSTG